MIPQFNKGNPDGVTCNRLDLPTLGSQPVMMPKNLPGHRHGRLIQGYKPTSMAAFINKRNLIRDNPKLLDDGGEIPKSQGRDWRYESRL